MRGKAKRIRWLLAVLFLTVPIQAQYGGGTGEPNDPYLIYTAEQMNAIGADPNDWDQHFKLMADIDLSGYKGMDFNIIGYGLLPAFTGVFDGNGHTISNFTYSSIGEPCIGIFGYIDNPNACIRNLGLIDPNIDGGTGLGVGPLAGWMDTGIVINCYVVNGNVSAKGSVGGLIGSNAGLITDCYATGNVSGSHSVGGLVGANIGYNRTAWQYEKGVIKRCFSAGSVSGGYRVGGLVGNNGQNAVTKNCSSTTSIIGRDCVGGLVGENRGLIVDGYSLGSIEAQNEVGGLVGTNDGIVTASCSSVSVTGRAEIGGLVGYNSDDAEIVDCYANGSVLGQNEVGGLVGSNATDAPRAGEIRSGMIRHCYSAGFVSGDQHVGGLIGRNGDDGVSGSFWDIETSDQATSNGGEGKTTLEMHNPNTFIGTGWDFVGAPGGPGDIWAESEGDGCPVLWWQLSPLPDLPAFSGGRGEPDNPYLISMAEELNNIGHNPRLMMAHFKLIDDIDLAGVDFYILTNHHYPFRGAFDGNGHTILNFTYTSTEATGVGFFRYVAGGQIENVNLTNPHVHVGHGDFHGVLVGFLEAGIVTHCHVESGGVTGRDEIGGLVGENNAGGVISNCSFTGDVAGRDDIGGLVGNNRGTIATSYSRAGVEGRITVGGFVGRCSPGYIANCYAQGDVIGEWYVGGLVGSNGSRLGRDVGTIRHCYSTTTILGGAQNGGLLGCDWGGEILNCFWDIEESDRTTSSGGTGKTTIEMQTAETFLDAGWDFLNETTNGTKDIWWILEGRDYPCLWWERAEGRE